LPHATKLWGNFHFAKQGQDSSHKNSASRWWAQYPSL